MKSHPTAYTYAVALLGGHWEDLNLTNMRALCQDYGVTEGELLMIEQNPQREYGRMLKEGTQR